MSKITIKDLEVFYCVGVSDAERAKPQRLLITADIAYDFSIATVSDRIERTIDYAEVSETLLKYGEGRSWKLIEKVAANVADMIVTDYKAQAATVEVKKFVIPQAQYVSVTWTKKR